MSTSKSSKTKASPQGTNLSTITTTEKEITMNTSKTLNIQFAGQDISVVLEHNSVVINPVEGKAPRFLPNDGRSKWSDWMSNLIVDLAIGYYGRAERGLLLHDEIETVALLGLPNPNVGVCSSEVLQALVDAGQIKRNKEVEKDAYYRISYDPTSGAFGRQMSYQAVDDNGEKLPVQPDWVSRNWNARNLLRASVVLSNAINAGLSLRVSGSEAYIEAKLEVLSLIADGEMDKAKELHNSRIAGKKLRDAEYRIQKSLETEEDPQEAPLAPAGMTVTLTSSEVVGIETLIGKTVKRFVNGGKLPVSGTIQVTATNAKAFALVTNQQRATVEIVS